MLSRGFYFGTTPNPNVNLTSVSGTTGVMSSNVTGLQAETLYYFRAFATNSNGTTFTSDGTFVTLTDFPLSSPTNLVTEIGDRQVTINFTAGADGGSAITNYEYSLDGGQTWISFNPAVTYSPVTIAGLSNGTAYDITLRAVNAQGASPASSSVTATPIRLLSGLDFTEFSDVIYNGLAATPPVLLSDGGVDLDEGDDFTVTYTNNINSGVATVTITGIGAYTGTLIKNFTILKKDLTITADNKTKVYGTANPTLTFSYDGLVNGDTQVATEPSISTPATVSSGVGAYPINLTGGSDVNYDITLVAGELEVTKAAVTITAVDKDKVYGSANPALTFTYSGLVNGDTKVATEPSISTPTTVSSGVGAYSINLTGGSDVNYDITLVAGELEVTKASLTITADTNQSKIYGANDPALTFIATGFVNNETESILTGSLARAAGENVGSYAINQGTFSAGSNYTITFTGADFAVTPAALSIIAVDKDKVYGSANPTLTFTYDGLVNGDTQVATEPSISTPATVSSGVGAYPINLTGGSDVNYDITLVAGELDVTKAAVTITAVDKDKVYGSENPALTFTYSGLVNGDTKVATEPSISTTATTSSAVGTYPITLTGGSDANYDIKLVAGELDVTKAAVTITAVDKDKVYGSENPALTFTYSGLVNGDTKVATEPSISTTATISSVVGTYPITLTSGSDANYDIKLVAGELDVTKAAVTITAVDKDKVYGSANPALTFTYSGLVNDDTKVTTEPSISTTATASSAVGTYPITLAGGSDANYEITLVAGALEVTKATLTITADSQIKPFGVEDPALTYQVSGLVNGDQLATVTGSLQRAVGEEPGSYAIGLGSLSAGNNYTINFVSADLTITASEIDMVFQPGNVETAWGQEPALPSSIGVMTADGQVLSFPITWNLSPLNIYARGDYALEAVINLSQGYTNPMELMANVTVTVLPKPAPQDLLLDNLSFRADSKNYQVRVGGLSVLDPIDNVHSIELVQGAYESSFFAIINNALYWNTTARVEGKKTFEVLIRVTDRDGNVIEKVFTIERTRESVSAIEIYNSFSPNGDGTNDTWGVPELRYYSGVVIQVFERSGKRLFYTQNPDIKWDGFFETIALPTGTYYWTVEVKETGEVRKGMLNLFRK
ncbi:gliding motility-associated C-terminal domain-containing protein [Belliella sp. DSM 111904]|uniref:Gliding motility-associated C-terminal domain-containing protein n=1 Tax=Belliella filtrata TaxID=2923435 RepID=A0ABS9V2K2_9BACT|nr:MBG domain-containing protein [Belliella filtrata]MCH7410652.1 gliding motility-associated C-terminal domain-containing protein [Belliella filtrata]